MLHAMARAGNTLNPHVGRSVSIPYLDDAAVEDRRTVAALRRSGLARPQERQGQKSMPRPPPDGRVPAVPSRDKAADCQMTGRQARQSPPAGSQGHGSAE